MARQASAAIASWERTVGYEPVPTNQVGPVALPSIRRTRRFKKAAELCRSPELSDGIQLLKRRRERIGQTPHGSGFKLLVQRREIELVDLPR
jgi:hypothetical protein